MGGSLGGGSGLPLLHFSTSRPLLVDIPPIEFVRDLPSDGSSILTSWPVGAELETPGDPPCAPIRDPGEPQK